MGGVAGPCSGGVASSGPPDASGDYYSRRGHAKGETYAKLARTGLDGVGPERNGLVTASSVPGVDAGSFEELLMPLLGSAYGTALRLTRNSADAEDLVQESVLLACRGFGSFQPGTNFKAWFFRVLTNCFFSKYRRQRRQGTPVELEDTPELYLYVKTAGAGLHATCDDPAGALMDRLDSEAVAEALGRLPDEYRVVATLYFIDDMAYQDIAATLGVPIGTVRSRLHRSRRMLQRQLWQVAKDRGIVGELVGVGDG